MCEQSVFILSKKDQLILNDIHIAKSVIMEFDFVESVENMLFYLSLSKRKVRKSLLNLNLCLSAFAGDVQAFQRQIEGFGSKVAYCDGMIGEFTKMMSENMPDEYTLEDVISLQKRMKDFVGQKKQAPRIMYIADCHFFHSLLCHDLDHRGFSDVNMMNEHMIAQWNEKVTQRDVVYIIGDFSIGKSGATTEILERLKGKKHLIIGNHDRYLDDKKFDRSLFESIEHYSEIRDNGRKVILSHYPVFCYNGQYQLDKNGKPRTFMLYGHVHDTHDEVLVNHFILKTRLTQVKSRHSDEDEPIPCQMINCFCMFSDYQPLTLDEWVEVDNDRRINDPFVEMLKTRRHPFILSPNHSFDII